MFSKQLKPVTLSPSTLDDVKGLVNDGDWNKQTNKIKLFKHKLKIELNKNQNGRCVYCERLLVENCPEIEHIAPKSIYPEVQFDLRNLAYACHRCNFPPHKADEDIVENKEGTYSNWSFKIVHPYFDNPADYFETGRKCCIVIKSSTTEKKREKAQNTIDLFDLNSTSMVEERIKEKVYKSLSADEIKRILEILDYHT